MNYKNEKGFVLAVIDIKKLGEYKTFVDSYICNRLRHAFVDADLMEICCGIYSILSDWTGNTYVGARKEKSVEQAYQIFFELLHGFLEFCHDNADKLSDKEVSLAQLMRFHGTVYRYLGKCDPRNNRKKEIVKPEYNDVYVSWSKSERNTYLESKLYGPRTWMKAEIQEPYFGIDIRGFEEWCEKWLGYAPFITRGDEREVVFPTFEKCIVEVK